jgi:23S rRNA pseudouridine1911/1915/1917 synthase
LVVAKTPRAREALKQQLAEHSMERVYRAITLGVPAPGRIQTLHARHPHARIKFTSRATRGKQAITHVSVIERFGDGAAALVECRLETGRTHQIRVHLAEQAGQPILADSLYGRAAPQELRAIEAELGRQALHAGVLGFVHPASGQWVRFEVEPPPDIERALAELRRLPPAAHSPRRSSKR